MQILSFSPLFIYLFIHLFIHLSNKEEKASLQNAIVSQLGKQTFDREFDSE